MGRTARFLYGGLGSVARACPADQSPTLGRPGPAPHVIPPGGAQRPGLQGLEPAPTGQRERGWAWSRNGVEWAAQFAPLCGPRGTSRPRRNPAGARSGTSAGSLPGGACPGAALDQPGAGRVLPSGAIWSCWVPADSSPRNPLHSAPGGRAAVRRAWLGHGAPAMGSPQRRCRGQVGLVRLWESGIGSTGLLETIPDWPRRPTAPLGGPPVPGLGRYAAATGAAPAVRERRGG